MADRKPALILLGAGRSQVPLLKKARESLRVVAVDQDPHAPGRTWADELLPVSTFDTRAVLQALQQLVQRYEFRGIVARTTAREALRTAVEVARRFRLPYLQENLVRISTEKGALRAFGQAHGLPVPRGRLVSKTDGAELDLSFPLLVKPNVTRVGKAGIAVCSHPAELPARMEAARRASADGCAEVQEYVEGIDSALLCRLQGGTAHLICWWDELVGIDWKGGVRGLGASVPSVTGYTPAQRRAEDTARRLASLFPESSGLLIFSFRITAEQEVYLIELHADLGGDLVADRLLPEADPGFDFFRLAVEASLPGSSPLLLNPQFLPTALLFSPEGEPLVWTGPTLNEILWRAETQFWGTRSDLRVLPGHLQWLQQKAPIGVMP